MIPGYFKQRVSYFIRILRLAHEQGEPRCFLKWYFPCQRQLNFLPVVSRKICYIAVKFPSYYVMFWWKYNSALPRLVVEFLCMGWCCNFGRNIGNECLFKSVRSISNSPFFNFFSNFNCYIVQSASFTIRFECGSLDSIFFFVSFQENWEMKEVWRNKGCVT